jgi:hypothetical protein
MSRKKEKNLFKIIKGSLKKKSFIFTKKKVHIKPDKKIGLF